MRTLGYVGNMGDFSRAIAARPVVVPTYVRLVMPIFAVDR
jgi:hypothetical protein